MSQRVNIKTAAPAGDNAILGMNNYISSGQLEKTHKSLIDIRASQINGCTYCIDLPSRDALKLGETTQRIFLLHAWRETDLFTEEERVILAMTEEITLIHQQGLSEETYRHAAGLFDEHYLSEIIVAIISINALNRLGVSTRLKIPVIEERQVSLQ